MPTPGPLELVIILVIALLVLGPGKLPDVGAALGKSIKEFRKASSDVQDAVRVDTSPIPSSTSTGTSVAQDQAATSNQTSAPAPSTIESSDPATTASHAQATPSSEPTPGTN